MAKGVLALFLVQILAVSANYNEVVSEVEQLEFLHDWQEVGLDIAWSDEARDIATATFYDPADDCDYDTTRRCVYRLRNIAECPEMYKCYKIWIRNLNYETRSIASNYVSAVTAVLDAYFVGNDSKVGCAMNTVGTTADVACVYFKLKRNYRDSILT